MCNSETAGPEGTAASGGVRGPEGPRRGQWEAVGAGRTGSAVRGNGTGRCGPAGRRGGGGAPGRCGPAVQARRWRRARAVRVGRWRRPDANGGRGRPGLGALGTCSGEHGDGLQKFFSAFLSQTPM